MMRMVAIIGSGAAGLCAARHVSNTPGLVPVIWEKSKSVGGTWVYTDQIDQDDYGLPVHSSMYKSLKTNLPKEVMSYPDFPFKSGGESFIHHTDVLSYLQDYANHFDLKKHIKFLHIVESVAPVTAGSSSTEWEVTVRDLVTDAVTTTVCHAVIVAVGHNSVPLTPTLPNIEEFSGLVQHSHHYREPQAYKGRTVAVLGAGASGVDIALELAQVAEKVFLCHNWPVPIPSQLPGNVQQMSGITGVVAGTHDTLQLRDGAEIQADALLYCTGYLYTYPFLAKECNLRVEGGQVRPLYRHLIHCQYPSLAIIGVPSIICPFPFFDVQIRYFLCCLVKMIQLPSCVAMELETESDISKFVALGGHRRHYHMMLLSKQWDYLDILMGDILSVKEGSSVLNEGTKSVGEYLDDKVEADRDHKYGDDGNTKGKIEDEQEIRKEVLANPKFLEEICCMLGTHVREIFEQTFYRRAFQLLEYKQYDYRVNRPNPDNMTAESEIANSGTTIRTIVTELRDGQETNYRREIRMIMLKQAPFTILGNWFSITKLLCSVFYYRIKKAVLRY